MQHRLSMKEWISQLVGYAPELNNISLSNYLERIPRLEQLHDLWDTVTIVRADLDVPLQEGEIQDDARLRSLRETLEFGMARGWRMILIGHLGRDPQLSSAPVRDRLAELYQQDPPFISDWLDPDTTTLTAEAQKQIGELRPGQFLVLENARKYPIETALWKPDPAQLSVVAERCRCLAESFGQVADVFVNECFAATNRDVSSCILPYGSRHAVLGIYIGREFRQVLSVLNAQLVVFSGLKVDKLDYLEGIVRCGKARLIIVGGSLAMAFLRARGRITGQEVSIGQAGMPENRGAKWYISEDRVDQAERILRQGEASEVRFVLPIDFILDDGIVTDQIPADRQQMDIGPRTIELFQREVERFIDEMRSRPTSAVAFYNGVMGKFEDPRFEQGTKAFVQLIKRMTDAGVKTYVGGGEGRLAVLKYGQVEWATHIFTAGGTVLRSMSDDIVPYLKALLLHTIDQDGKEVCY